MKFQNMTKREEYHKLDTAYGDGNGSIFLKNKLVKKKKSDKLGYIEYIYTFQTEDVVYYL